MLAYLDERQQRVDSDDGGTTGEFERSPPPAEETDFGGIKTSRPKAVFHPSTTDEVVSAVRLAAQHQITVAARGNGHSVSGQAMADGGVVLDMRSLHPRRFELIPSLSGDTPPCADVPGGALWEEILEWSYNLHGLSPASWTDYLGLTVGGTLSNAGISGQTFKYGPQITMVEEIEIVTGEGDRRVCTAASHSDLFHAALGGLGQFGIITRARIPLFPAPSMVKWMRLVYGDFESYRKDAEWLVNRPSQESFDYIEGFGFVNRPGPADGWESVPLGESERFDSGLVPADSGPVLYCLELVLHYQLHDNVDKTASEMIRPLKYIRGLDFVTNVSYVGFLSRVKQAEKEARANGSWHVPHPWLNLLVAAADIADFERHVFRRILKDGIGGPMLVYPMLKSKWNPQTSVALPESEVFYLVALLRFTRPFPDGPPVADLIAQNRRIVDCCETNGYDYKIYLPHYTTQEDWARHFGNEWPRFVERKARYDPMAILAPGQNIFSRPLNR